MLRDTDICIIGGGPAGSVLAARLAQLGWNVGLLERSPFPRRHLGESLSPGVIPLVESIGAGPVIERASFTPVKRVDVIWEEKRSRVDPKELGRLVDRGPFDLMLLNHARECGARVWQPATVRQLKRGPEGWILSVAEGGRLTEIRARFLADATGRTGLLPRRRLRTGPKTLALHAYWTGTGLPEQPRIEAGTDEWYWGVPLPEGLYNTLVFLDPGNLRAMPGTLEEKFHRLLTASSILPSGAQARLVGRVGATDATPFFDENCVTNDSIKVGDAALALDPLSSSGVQKAIQTALSGAVVVNTLLRRPESATPARQFFRDNLSAASASHRAWASGHYGRVSHRGSRFWRERSSDVPAPSAEAAPPRRSPASIFPGGPLTLSPGVTINRQPCITGDYVTERPAVSHPSLVGPIAYLGGVELAPLLAEVRVGMTTGELARCWRRHLSDQESRAITEWLVTRGLLIPAAEAPAAVEGRGA